MPQTLVCEGACNPHIASLDAKVRALRRREQSYRLHRMYPLDDLTVVEQLRQLRATPHEPVAPGIYRCTVCQGTRRYGLAPDPQPSRVQCPA